MLSSVIRTNVIISKNIIASRFKLLHRKHHCLDVIVQVKEKRFTACAAKFKTKIYCLYITTRGSCSQKERKNKGKVEEAFGAEGS